MKTIQSYILERLVLNRHGKITNPRLKELIGLIIVTLGIDEYANNDESEDNLNDIIKGIKEGILIADITGPYFLTRRSFYNEMSDYDKDVKNINIIPDNDYYKICQKISYKNAEKVFESNEEYGLNIYANEYGINFAFYHDSIFVIDQNSKIIDDIDK